MTWSEIFGASQLVITIGGFVWVLATQKSNQDRLVQIVITGTQGQPGLTTRTEGLERRVDSIEKICDERHDKREAVRVRAEEMHAEDLRAGNRHANDVLEMMGRNKTATDVG